MQPLVMDSLATTIQALGDLELAVLLSLIAEQHCIITTNNGFVQPLAEELMAVCSIANSYPSPFLAFDTL